MEPLETLHHYFGYDSFRGIQEEIIKSILAGHDTLGLMPTGGGKSITFQVPALMMEGVCIVVTPLISLMKDQVTHLKQRGIKAEAIYSGLLHQEVQRILDNAIYGAVKFLYVSPERLHTKLFLSKLYYMKVCFITVDEAHCISQWGYDFRPSYLQITKLREEKPNAPVLALTATATPTVIEDIQKKLDFGNYTTTPNSSPLSPNTFNMSFKRENLSYVVRKTEDIEGEMLHILNSVPGSAIVYARDREKTKKISDFLNRHNVKATYYHAGLDIAIKDTRQEEWSNNIYRVMVATNAFGMGIDKPDVRLVIHITCPSSLEEYFQEAGRAGRDGKRAYAVLLQKENTVSLLKNRVDTSFPSKDFIREIYDDLAYFFQLAEDSGQGARYEFDLNVFCYRFHHYPADVEPVLNILKNAGYIDYDPEPNSSARVMFSVTREDMYYIQGLSTVEDEMITHLLRYYGSLFSELTFISEQFMSQKLGLDTNHIHVVLKGLAQRHIIRYVPRRSVPLITYTQQRINSSRLRFAKEVYDDLALRMKERINAVVRYLENDDECRVKVLLRYFGEVVAEDCHHCDVCLSDNKDDATPALKVIMSLLADGKRHSLAELHLERFTKKQQTAVLETLRKDERIVIKDNFIILQE